MSNPCLKCPTEQSCCRELNGLKINEAEYTKLFAGNDAHLTVKKKGKLYEISSLGGGPCPHWNEQCQIYGSRPMDCDLYPYTMGNVFESEREVYATYHSRTQCPLSEDLLGPREKAEALILAFLKETYGEGVKITVRYDEGAARLYHLARRAAAKAKRLMTGSQT